MGKVADALSQIRAGADPESVADWVREAVTGHYVPKSSDEMHSSMLEDDYDPTDTWAEVEFAKASGELSGGGVRGAQAGCHQLTLQVAQLWRLIGEPIQCITSG